MVVKQTEELIVMGGKFYELEGEFGFESWCDTAIHSWKLVPGVGYVRQD